MVKRRLPDKRPDQLARSDFFRRIEAPRGDRGDDDWRPRLRVPDMNMIRDWSDHLTAQRIAWTTIQSYVNDIANLARWLSIHHQGFDLRTFTRKQCESWQAWIVTQGLSDSTLHRRFMAVRALDNWLRDIGEIDEARTSRSAPRVELKPISVIPIADIEAVARLLDGEARRLVKRRRNGKPTADEVDARRDLAVVMIALACGLRVDELARLTLDDIDRNTKVITVRNPKGGESKGRQLAIPADLGAISKRLPSPLECLNAYRRVRDARRLSGETDALWIGDKGQWTTNGIRLMLRRRCEQAQVPVFTPHRFRHTWAHWCKVLGMQHGDLKVVGGWSSDSMVDRYGRSEAQARALDVHRDVFTAD